MKAKQQGEIADAAREAAKRIEHLERLIDEALDTDGTPSIHMILEGAV